MVNCMLEHSPSSDQFQCCTRIPLKRLFPSFVAPALAETISHEQDGDIMFYEFCNGGDLDHVIRKCSHNGIHIPEDFYWSFTSQMISILAYIHTGWTLETGAQQDWEPIEHGDNWPCNIFLHWTNANDVLPQFLLGDCDMARIPLYKFLVMLSRDLDVLQHTVENMIDEQPQRIPNAAYEVFMKLIGKAKKKCLAEGDLCFSQYIAERFVPLAMRNLAQL